MSPELQKPPKLPLLASPALAAAFTAAPTDAYGRYLVNCSDYLRRQIMVYQHWPQRRYDVLGYRDEKVFADRNA